MEKNKQFRDIMIDIETVDNVAGSAILAIGAVEFDITTGENIKEFYEVVNLQSCLDNGLTMKMETVKWWLQEDSELFNNLLNDPKQMHISLALQRLRDFINIEDNGSDNVRVWGNSNRFDLGILAKAYEKALHSKFPWVFWLERDVRTLMDLPNIINEVRFSIGESQINMPDFKLEETANAILNGSIAHNPVDDCKVQIKYITKTLKQLTQIIL